MFYLYTNIILSGGSRKLAGTDHLKKTRREASSMIRFPAPVNETRTVSLRSSYYDNAIFYYLPLHSLSENYKIIS